MANYADPNSVRNETGQTRRWYKNPFTLIGASFILLGVLAIVAPVVATMTSIVFLAVLMLFWGGLGIAFVLRSEGFPNRMSAALGYGFIALIGAGFLFFPTFGAEVLTFFLVAGLLVEGVFSVLYAISISSRRGDWIWMALSGVAALAVGILVILGWPETAVWLIGLCLGINFMTTGIAILALSRASTR